MRLIIIIAILCSISPSAFSAENGTGQYMSIDVPQDASAEMKRKHEEAIANFFIANCKLLESMRTVEKGDTRRANELVTEARRLLEEAQGTFSESSKARVSSIELNPEKAPTVQRAWAFLDRTGKVVGFERPRTFRALYDALAKTLGEANHRLSTVHYGVNERETNSSYWIIRDVMTLNGDVFHSVSTLTVYQIYLKKK